MVLATETEILETSEVRPQFSLVIPAYNEVGRIESTLKDLMFTLVPVKLQQKL